MDSLHQISGQMSLTYGQCEITTLKWPMIFGEACILEPESGVSLGTRFNPLLYHIISENLC
jgi:hypothetical protein